MIKRTVAIIALVFSTLGLHLAIAAPASAAIERCVNTALGWGVTLRYCVYVDLANGRASAQVLWNQDAFPQNLRLIPTIVRDWQTTTNHDCQFFAVGYQGTSGSSSCNAYAKNPPDPQRWRASIEVVMGVGPDAPSRYYESETIIDT